MHKSPLNPIVSFKLRFSIDWNRFRAVSSDFAMTSSFVWSRFLLLRLSHEDLMIWEMMSFSFVKNKICDSLSSCIVAYIDNLTTYWPIYKSKRIQFLAKVNKEDIPGFPTWDFHNNSLLRFRAIWYLQFWTKNSWDTCTWCPKSPLTTLNLNNFKNKSCIAKPNTYLKLETGTVFWYQTC